MAVRVSTRNETTLYIIFVTFGRRKPRSHANTCTHLRFIELRFILLVYRDSAKNFVLIRRVRRSAVPRYLTLRGTGARRVTTIPGCSHLVFTRLRAPTAEADGTLRRLCSASGLRQLHAHNIMHRTSAISTAVELSCEPHTAVASATRTCG